jgi:hypothetical protein
MRALSIVHESTGRILVREFYGFTPEVTTLVIRMPFQLLGAGNGNDQSDSSLTTSHTISIPFYMAFWDFASDLIFFPIGLDVLYASDRPKKF